MKYLLIISLLLGTVRCIRCSDEGFYTDELKDLACNVVVSKKYKSQKDLMMVKGTRIGNNDSVEYPIFRFSSLYWDIQTSDTIIKEEESIHYFRFSGGILYKYDLIKKSDKMEYEKLKIDRDSFVKSYFKG